MKTSMPAAVGCLFLAACALSHEPESGHQASLEHAVLGEFDADEGLEAEMLQELSDLDEASRLDLPSTEQYTPLGWLGWYEGPPAYNLVGTIKSATVITDIWPPSGLVLWDLAAPSGTDHAETQLRQDVFFFFSSVSISFGARGEYFLSAQTLDGGYAFGEFVAHNPPVAQSIAVSGTMRTGHEITFTGTGTIDEDYSKYGESNTPKTFKWKIAGQTKYGAIVKHTFSSPGTYTIKLQIYDGTYWSAAKSKTVSIGSSSPPPPPPCKPCPTCCQIP